MSKINIVIIFIVSLLQGLQGQISRHLLHDDWRVLNPKDGTWYPAVVPGEVHTDLIRNGLIENPFRDTNEQEVQWISENKWYYLTTFAINKAQLESEHCRLIFEGLDTYAEVFLNGARIIVADNMFRAWSADVKPLLKPGMNELIVLFHPATSIIDSMAAKDLPFIIPDHPRAYVRKAGYQFGWDWGPKLTGAGIWKEVSLNFWDREPVYLEKIRNKKVELVRDTGGFHHVHPGISKESFYFKINNVPVYMKGANYIPMDVFPSRVTTSDYRLLLTRAKDANINMLRVWGGGIYEDNEFYRIADSLGIYIWQDFMFAGTMVPGKKTFFNNVKEEVIQQVRRLKNYECIVLWCGNNEVDEAWHHWGWRKQFGIQSADSARLWHDYTRLFRDSIPVWIREAGDDRPYVSTSPQYGWGNPLSLGSGDSHYWGIWWGMEDFENFEFKTGRFVSEFGIQATPGTKLLNQYISRDQQSLTSPAWRSHQKANRGYEKINEYIHRYIIDTTGLNRLSIAEYDYLSQCLQYYALKDMILIQRSFTPYNMGTLLWQLNDCWPVTSWSILNYDNHPKAGWYAVKKVFADDHTISRDTIRPIHLTLSNPKLRWKLKGYTLTIHTKKYAKFVRVEADNFSGTLSDNYFDMEPGEIKTIEFRHSEHPIKKRDIHIQSLYKARKAM